MGQEEVHTAIWSNIHRKHFYLAEQAPICAETLTGVAEQVLKGEYVLEQPIYAVTQELFKAIAEIQKRVRENTVLTNITHRQWADFWGKSKEETSSSRSGLHFGHYIAGALSNIEARHFSGALGTRSLDHAQKG